MSAFHEVALPPSAARDGRQRLALANAPLRAPDALRPAAEAVGNNRP